MEGWTCCSSWQDADNIRSRNAIPALLQRISVGGLNLHLCLRTFLLYCFSRYAQCVAIISFVLHENGYRCPEHNQDFFPPIFNLL